MAATAAAQPRAIRGGPAERLVDLAVVLAALAAAGAGVLVRARARHKHRRWQELEGLAGSARPRRQRPW